MQGGEGKWGISTTSSTHTTMMNWQELALADCRAAGARKSASFLVFLPPPHPPSSAPPLYPPSSSLLILLRQKERILHIHPGKKFFFLFIQSSLFYLVNKRGGIGCQQAKSKMAITQLEGKEERVFLTTEKKFFFER